MGRRTRIGAFLLCLICGSVLAVYAQGPTASSSTGLRANPTPVPTVTPIPVLVVTPVVTLTPPSPWPEPLEKAWGTVRAFWGAFGWWVVPLLVVALLLALIRQVGGELLDTWAKGIATWVKDWLQNLLARLGPGPDKPARALLKDVLDRCERLEIKGIAREKVTVVSLESIYVPLFAAGEAAPGLGCLSHGGEVGLMMVRGEADRLVPVAKLLPEYRCLVIVGEAGSGKSTFLRYVALTLAQALRDRRLALVHRNLGWEPKPVPLPILLPLSGFGLYLKDLSDAKREYPNPGLLLDYLNHHFRHPDLPDGYLERRLREGNCLLLLDGLDEVARFSDRQFISETVTLFSKRYGKCRFVITCRPEGYREAARLGGDFHEDTLVSLRWPEDIATFVRRWNEAVLGVGTRSAQENTEDFMQRLEERGQVRALADNPLLLTAMVIVHFNVGKLPEGRADLYDTCTELLLGWDARWGRQLVAPPPWLDDMGIKEKRLPLEEVALRWQRENTLEMRRSEVEEFLAPRFQEGAGEEKEREARKRAEVFLGWVIERTYLMRELGETLGFYRRAFQEYLAARGLGRESYLDAQVLQALEQDWDWWEETVLLTIGHLSTQEPGKARGVLEALQKAEDSPEAPHRSLILAARGLADAARSPLGWELQERIVERLVQAIADPNPTFAVPARIQAAKALGALGDPRPGVCTWEPELVRVPAGIFLMGSSPEEVERWKKFTRERIEDGTYKPSEGMTKERLFEIYSAWLGAEEGVHEIDIPQFFIARYPVTNAQFTFFIENEGYERLGYWTEAGRQWRRGEGEGWGRPPECRDQPMFWHDPRFNRPNQPVVGITWYEAVAYCGWLTGRMRESADQRADESANGWAWPNELLQEICDSRFMVRLPTEAEWEKAARGGLFLDGDEKRHEPNLSPQRTWAWEGEWDENKANTWEGRVQATTPVGLYPAGRSPYGVLDMLGNVWEWTNTRWGTDWWKPDYGLPYRSGEREDPEGAFLRVLRGGSWLHKRRDGARCAYRNRAGPDRWSDDVGFRLVVAPAFF
jgi:formylglycine-generating enzyme required for sulfatase activity